MLIISINPKWIARGKEPLKRKHTLLTALTMLVLFFIFAVNDSGNSKTIPTTSPSIPTVSTPAKTPEQIAQEKADAELKTKQAEEAKVAAEAKAKADAEAKVAAEKAAAAAKITTLKNEAQSIPYKDLARNPDNYKGKKVKYTGKVIQVQEEGKNVGLRVNVTKGAYGYDDTMFVMYDKGIVNGRVLEDDIISFWGTSAGLLTYKTVMGAEMTIPQAMAQIVEVN